MKLIVPATRCSTLGDSGNSYVHVRINYEKVL